MGRRCISSLNLEKVLEVWEGDCISNSAENCILETVFLVQIRRLKNIPILGWLL